MSGQRDNRILHILIILGIAVLIMSVSLTGCYEGAENSKYKYKVSYDDTGNKIFTVNKGVGSFSMVCPPRFEAGDIEIFDADHIEVFGHIYDNDHKYTHAYLDRTDLRDYEVDIRVFINVDVSTQYITSDNLTADAAYLLAQDINMSRYTVNFQMLDESTVTVAGVEANQIDYSWDQYPVTDPHTPIIPDKKYSMIPRIERKVFFNHSGLIWKISLFTVQPDAELDLKDFELVLSTFRVLNK